MTKMTQPLKRKPLLAALFVISLAVIIPAFGKGRAKRLHFKKGEDSITVRGYLHGVKDSVSYLLTVKAHQTIEVRNSCGGRNEILTASNIYDPSGKEVSDDHDMQGNNGVTETKTGGTYRIEVAPNLKGATHRGSFCNEITVTNTQR
jgi:hypothetical protein